MKDKEIKFILKSKDSEIKKLLSNLLSRYKVITDGKKVCAHCFRALTPDNFYVDKYRPDGRNIKCIKCMRAYDKTTLTKNKKERSKRSSRESSRRKILQKKYQEELAEEAEAEKKKRHKNTHQYIDEYYTAID